MADRRGADVAAVGDVILSVRAHEWYVYCRCRVPDSVDGGLSDVVVANEVRMDSQRIRRSEIESHT
jgi:hypothetical protein